MDHLCLLRITTTDYYSPIPITAGTNPDTVGVKGTIKFHSPFVYSIQTGSKGTVMRRQHLLLGGRQPA